MALVDWAEESTMLGCNYVLIQNRIDKERKNLLYTVLITVKERKRDSMNYEVQNLSVKYFF